MSSIAVLEGLGLTKSFGGTPVVQSVDICVREGEIRAVIGENGAGKSTLMKLLTGVTQPDSGEIRIRGVPTLLNSPRRAAEAGIAMVHQELQLVPEMSVADNLMLVRPPTAGRVRRGTRAERAYVHSIIRRVGLDVDAEAIVSALSTAQCQMLEIAKALALDAKVIIFDEPTSALQSAEIERLLALVQALRAEGHAILYISHALEEILRISDCISVLRDGRHVADLDRSEADPQTLIVAMVNRAVGLYSYELPTPRKSVVLEAKDVKTHRVRDLNFQLHAGEILGFSGLMGSGMQEAALAMCGADRITGGVLKLDGAPVKFREPHEAAAAGILLVPEERKQDGILADLSVCENLHVGRYHRHKRRGLVSPARLRVAASDLLDRFRVRLRSMDQPIATLSGGNQQKVLIARCVQSNPRALIVASPTRGVDIGAKEAIHRIILELASQGTAMIVVSPELEELLGLAHRIAVFSGGRMSGILAREDATPSRIMELAISHDRERRHHVS